MADGTWSGRGWSLLGRERRMEPAATAGKRAGGAARCSPAAGAAVQQQELKVSSSRKSRTIAALISKFLGRRGGGVGVAVPLGQQAEKASPGVSSLIQLSKEQRPTKKFHHQ